MNYLEAYALTAPGKPSQQAIEAYQRDGVVCLKNAFDGEWIEQGRRAVAAGLRSAKNSERHRSHKRKGEQGSFFFDTFLWKRLPSFKKYTFESPASQLARQIMQTQSLLLYFDMTIVKEPGTSAHTPWHYDEAYWPIAGSQACNIWMPLDPVPEETALSFVPGSHKLGIDFSAIDFFDNNTKKGHTRPPPPQWHEIEGDHKVLCAPVDPGDCVILNFRTHHSAPGNLQKRNRRRVICTHWMGDDIRFDDKPWTCSPNERGENLQHGGPMECETFPRFY